MAKFKEHRVGMLVDVQNMYYSARILFSKKVSFKNVLLAGTADRKLIRAIAYGIKTVEGMEEKFFEALEKSGFEVKTKDLQIFPDGSKKGDWDVGITIDVLDAAPRVDEVVLASGDGDFAILLDKIRASYGVEAVAYGVPGLTAQALMRAANRYVPIEGSLLLKN